MPEYCQILPIGKHSWGTIAAQFACHDCGSHEVTGATLWPCHAILHVIALHYMCCTHEDVLGTYKDMLGTHCGHGMLFCM